MPSGFQQRWKGKVNAAVLWLGGQPQNGIASALALTTSSTTTTIPSAGVTTIVSSSVLSIWRLQPPRPHNINMPVTIQLTTVSSGVFITTSTDGSVLINGSSINTTIKSTQAGVIEMVPTSTTNWAIRSVFPGSTLVSSILTLSTST